MDIQKFILDNIFVVVVAVVSGAMLVWPMVRRTGGGASVDTLGATMLINKEDALVLDVREPAEFAAGHVLNARNVPLSQLESSVADLARYKKKPVIVCCNTGSRSGAAVTSLGKLGFEQVVNLSGGLAAWRAAGLPTGRLDAGK